MIDQLNKILAEFKQMEASDLLLQVGGFVFWIVVILLATSLLTRYINRTVKDNSARYRTKKIIRLASYVLIGLLAIFSFTGNMEQFGLSLGLITAGLAFALQEVILSVFGWIIIFTTNSYSPGDRIEINGIKGDVIDIGVTKTTLMEIGEWVKSDNYNGRIVQISNSFIFKGPVRNYSTDFPFVWDEIKLPITFNSDLELVGKIVKQATDDFLMDYAKFAKENWELMVKKYLIENANVEPSLQFILNDNWVEFTLRYVVDYKKRGTTKHQLFNEIYNSVMNSGGKVAFASATFELVGVPELKVKLEPPNKSFDE
ncbi:MAG: mechanosensitive ion channel [Candidatus Kapaibacterium sp.]|nr:mechanosensitive ion channel [Ignavibacteriota bacterium]MCB9220344.1 mechanosensitive ion channel [Ignavibacteria bacterium]